MKTIIEYVAVGCERGAMSIYNDRGTRVSRDARKRRYHSSP